MTAEWSIDVRERAATGTHVVGTMSSDDSATARPVLAVDGRDPLRDVGACTLDMPVSSSRNPWFVEGRFVLFKERGQQVAAMVHKSSSWILAAPDKGPTGEVVTHHLATLFDLLNEGVVVPPRGTDNPPEGHDIIFDSSHPDFDYSGWDTPAELMTVDAAITGWPVPPFGKNTPDPTAVQVIGPPGSGVNRPPGRSYYRIDANVVDDGIYGIWATGDNAFEVRIDGVVLIPRVNTFGTAAYAEILLAAGTHTFWAWCENGGSSDNPTGFSLACWALNENGDPATQAVVTDSSWKVDVVPAEPPGFTVGEIVRLLIEDAQTRGACMDIALGFDDTTDSNSVAWPNTYDISAKSNTTLATFFLKDLAETYADFEMVVDETNGGAILYAYGFDTRGADVDVELVKGTNIGYLRIDEAPTLASAFLTEYHDGFHWVEVTPVSGQPRREAPLTLGAQHTLGEVGRVALGQLALFGRLRSQVTVHHLTGPQTLDAEMPGLAYWTGDSITVPGDKDYTPFRARVVAMTWHLNPTTQQIEFIPELGDSLIPAHVLTGQALQKLAPQNLLGRVRPAAPVHGDEAAALNPGTAPTGCA